MQIDTDRLARIKTLYKGKHDPNGKMCVMEAVAYIAREPWSDSPTCVSPVIARFARTWNDDLPDDLRDEYLKPLIPTFVGTVGGDALENRRATMAADWLVRIYTPAWLRLAGLTAHADALANLPEITDFRKTPALMPALRAAQKDAAAAGAAAWDAAGAAWDAAGAAGAARAAGAKLAPTVKELQQSALSLLIRMIEAKD